MKIALLSATAALAALMAPPAGASTFVASINATPTVIGAVVAGTSYTVTTTGISDLFNSFNGGQGLTFTADGIPTYTFPAPYQGFNPAGSNNDPTSGLLCTGGVSALCGALIGAVVPAIGAAPVSYFQLGANYTFTAATTGFLIGLVNDVSVVNAYNDNGPEGFTVTLSTPNAGAVPELSTWAMMIIGVGMVGAVLRRRRASAVQSSMA